MAPWNQNSKVLPVTFWFHGQNGVLTLATLVNTSGRRKAFAVNGFLFKGHASQKPPVMMAATSATLDRNST
jgi:hypothetical protein